MRETQRPPTNESNEHLQTPVEATKHNPQAVKNLRHAHQKLENVHKPAN